MLTAVAALIVGVIAGAAWSWWYLVGSAAHYPEFR